MKGISLFMKRTMKSSATAALATLALALGPGSAQAAQITVPSKEYPTMQAGVAAAKPGDTVLVLPGTYTDSSGEGVFVSIGPDKPGLQLKAAGPPGSVKIAGVVPMVSGQTWVGLWIDADNALVEGFDISGFQTAIVAGETYGGPLTQGARITRNNMHDCSAFGIYLGPSTNYELDGNTTHGGVLGIDVQGPSPASSEGPSWNAHIHHNRANATSCPSGGTAPTGIYVASAPGCKLDNNECENNGMFGIYLASSPNCTAERNKTDNNGAVGIPGMYNAVGDGIGIYVGSSDNCTVVNNEANNNTGCGIWVGGPDCTVSNNKADGNASYGIAVIGGGGSTVANNEADNNGSVGSVWSIGIWVYDNSPGCRVVSNEADNNLADGIQTSGSCGSTFAFNVAKGNERYDVSDWDTPATCNTYLDNRAGVAWPSLSLWDVVTPPKR
jgi:parallel beta-helix repeat protein